MNHVKTQEQLKLDIAHLNDQIHQSTDIESKLH